jgi:hypothetical protein
MQDSTNKRRPSPASRSQTPLWFVAGGLAIAVYSRVMKDEAVGDVVLFFGLAFATVALVYWLVRPKHGL